MLGQAKRHVAELFARLHPEEQGFAHLKVDEPDRFVIWVWYGRTIPPRYKFFYVNKNDLVARVMEDDSSYRPKQWR